MGQAPLVLDEFIALLFWDQVNLNPQKRESYKSLSASEKPIGATNMYVIKTPA